MKGAKEEAVAKPLIITSKVHSFSNIFLYYASTNTPSGTAQKVPMQDGCQSVLLSLGALNLKRFSFRLCGRVPFVSIDLEGFKKRFANTFGK